SCSFFCHAHASTNEYIHRFRLNAPTQAYTLRTCCCCAPHTSLTSWNVSSIALRAAIASRIDSTLAVMSVQKKATQPSSSATSTTRMAPPAGGHVATNVLYVLVTVSLYCTHSTVCQPPFCAARLARLRRFLP